MRHRITLFALFLPAAFGPAGCGSNTATPTPTQPTPVQIVETFTGTLTVNGAQIHVVNIERAGTMTATLETISDQTATVGLSLGTWNGAACQIIIISTTAALGTTVTGTAQSTGQFCVLLNDVGKLTSAVDYSVDVAHF